MKMNFSLLGRVASVGIVILAPLRKIRHSSRLSALKSQVHCARRQQEPDHEDEEDNSGPPIPIAAEPEVPRIFPEQVVEQEEFDLRQEEEHSSIVPQPSKSNGSLERDITPRPANLAPNTPNVERKLRYNFNSARQLLEDAQKMLYDRDFDFDREIEEHQRALDEGEEVGSRTELDIQQFQETQRLTRWLVKAETKYEVAKAAMLDAGIQPPGSDIDSGFIDNVDDGYRISMERDWVVSADSYDMHQWLDNIPDNVDSSETAVCAYERDVDSWDADEVDICDSWSMVADGPQRRRIDKWRALSAAAHEG
ncbi:hypothetical protein AC579_7292 [Pseudocercospora musae]|uniref:Uncharacterized protein n=1 Tax=Pseudocercospora musae TaxID=113226 RepID=A0A139I3C0_9PEZI|nr:hypothetical protein AC579_7292 [Pseudocercospora musae]